MIICPKGIVKINYIHRITDEKTGQFKKYSFSIWIGKTGFGKQVDRYRTGACYVELPIPFEEYEWKGKKYKRATLFNCVFELMDYDSTKDNKAHELWILKSFETKKQDTAWQEEKIPEDNLEMETL